ncbi:MAG: DnaA/Hda family protein [Simkaniaceae bacterium]|nr:DnaA/Hda family protein [Simkaniaceae bacterium]
MKIWTNFLEQLEKEIGTETVKRWLTPLKLHRYDAGNIYLHADDSFAINWFEEHIASKAKTRLTNNNGRPIKIHISLASQDGKTSGAQQKPQSHRPIDFIPDKLDPHHTFEQFIPGPDNVVPLKLLANVTGFNLETQELIEPTIEPTTYNPIFIYGGPGVGKTHLLMAAATVLELHGKKTFYVRASSFTEHVISAIRRGVMQEFRAAYRHVDVLIIDDVQDLIRKNATQEELFHTFNTLHTTGRQIILSGNCSPQMLDGIEERLISRFEWGITLPLTSITTTNELHQILSRRSQLFKFPVQKELTDFITHKFPSAHSLSHAIESLILHAHLDKLDLESPLSLNRVKEHLTHLFEEENKAKLTPDKVLQLISEIFGLKTEDITGKSQSRECVLPRQIAMYVMRSELKMPYMKIGAYFSRDHSTVMSSIKSIKKGLETKDKEIAFYLSDVQRKLLNN